VEFATGQKGTVAKAIHTQIILEKKSATLTEVERKKMIQEDISEQRERALVL
jgi:predicted polyphosphate/ATP-dependent NAD kinase